MHLYPRADISKMQLIEPHSIHLWLLSFAFLQALTLGGALGLWSNHLQNAIILIRGQTKTK